MTFARSSVPHLVLCVLVSGCSVIAGMESPELSECISNADCPSGKVCSAWKCVTDCGGDACSDAGITDRHDASMSSDAMAHDTSIGVASDQGGDESPLVDSLVDRGGEPPVLDAHDVINPLDMSSEIDTSFDGHDDRSVDAQVFDNILDRAGDDASLDSGATHDASDTSQDTQQSDLNIDSADAIADVGGDCGPLGCGRCAIVGDGTVGGCQAVCSELRGCVTPPSCNALQATCGSNMNCCLSLPIPGGSFNRSCDARCRESCSSTGPYPATISPFTLDAFEVTVGRFRKFVIGYNGTWAPPLGSGKNPNNPTDPGWKSEWNTYLPLSNAALLDRLSTGCFGANGTWTPTDIGGNEDKALNCVDWFLAYAFCIWDDGARLPTAAEWNFAAAGGNQQRWYPWSDPGSQTIDDTHAVYGATSTSPQRAGSKRNGRGRWDHHDLAGNVAEWVIDYWEDCYSTEQCDDCARTTPGRASDERVCRGGSYVEPKERVAVETRMIGIVDGRFHDVGFRCARNLD